MSFEHTKAVLDGAWPSTGAKLVAAILANFCDSQTGECFPSLKTIADAACMKPRMARYNLRIVLGTGRFTVGPRYGEKGQRSNLYRYVAPADPAPPATDCMGGMQQIAGAGCNGLHGPPATSCIQNKSLDQTSDQITGISSPADAPHLGRGNGSKPVRKSRKGKKTEAPDPRHSAITSRWSAIYKQEWEQPYAFNGRDASTLKRFLKTLPAEVSAEDILGTARKAWQRTRADRYAKACPKASSIHGLCTAWNDIQTELQRSEQGRPTRRPDHPTDVSLEGTVIL